MRDAAWVRIAAALVLLAAVFGVTLSVAARIGPFAAVLGVALFGAAYLAMRIKRGRR
jgi:hypothetical protein